MYTALGPTGGTEPSKEQSIVSLLCKQALLLIPASPWSRSMEVVVEQDQASRPVVTGALYGHAREEREAGALAMPEGGKRAEATVANDEIEAERKGK